MNSSIGSDSDERLDAAIRSVFDDIVAATERPGRTNASDRATETSPTGRWWLAVAAVALLVAGAAGLVGVSQRQDVNDIEGTAEGVSTTSAIAWQQATEVGSIAGSSVDWLVGNNSGFVAAGSGLDNGNTQGRVWFSLDGLGWVEPALGMFGSMTIVDAAATDDAFYVLASPSASDTPTTQNEPTPDVVDNQIYRSANGTDWTAWGQPDDSTTAIFGAGSNLVRETGQYSLEWSANGDDWFASEVPPDEQWARFFLHPYGHFDADATYVLGARSEQGTENNEWTIWSSPDDGQTWTRLPPPPVDGESVAIGEIPNGVLVSFGPGADRCNLHPDAVHEDDLQNPPLRCDSPLELVEFDAETNQWHTITAIGPGPASARTPITHLGDALIAPILEPGNSTLTIWTASLGADDWSPDPTTTLRFKPNLGSPNPIDTATSNGTIVIVSPYAVANGSSPILVGTTT